MKRRGLSAYDSSEVSPDENQSDDVQDSTIDPPVYVSSAEIGRETEAERITLNGRDAGESELENSDSSAEEDVSSKGGFVEQDFDIFDTSLFDGSTLTLGASSLLILQFCRKYDLPRGGQNDLLKLIALHLPEGLRAKLPKSRTELIRLALPSLNAPDKQKVCTVCNRTVLSTDAACGNGHPQTPGQPRKSDVFFITIPLEPQIRRLIEGELHEKVL